MGEIFGDKERYKIKDGVAIYNPTFILKSKRDDDTVGLLLDDLALFIRENINFIELVLDGKKLCLDVWAIRKGETNGMCHKIKNHDRKSKIKSNEYFFIKWLEPLDDFNVVD